MWVDYPLQCFAVDFSLTLRTPHIWCETDKVLFLGKSKTRRPYPDGDTVNFYLVNQFNELSVQQQFSTGPQLQARFRAQAAQEEGQPRRSASRNKFGIIVGCCLFLLAIVPSRLIHELLLLWVRDAHLVNLNLLVPLAKPAQLSINLSTLSIQLAIKVRILRSADSHLRSY